MLPSNSVRGTVRSAWATHARRHMLKYASSWPATWVVMCAACGHVTNAANSTQARAAGTRASSSKATADRRVPGVASRVASGLVAPPASSRARRPVCGRAGSPASTQARRGSAPDYRAPAADRSADSARIGRRRCESGRARGRAACRAAGGPKRPCRRRRYKGARRLRVRESCDRPAPCRERR